MSTPKLKSRDKLTHWTKVKQIKRKPTCSWVRRSKSLSRANSLTNNCKIRLLRIILNGTRWAQWSLSATRNDAEVTKWTRLTQPKFYWPSINAVRFLNKVCKTTLSQSMPSFNTRSTTLSWRRSQTSRTRGTFPKSTKSTFKMRMNQVVRDAPPPTDEQR